MNYISTRGYAPVSPSEAVLAGLAPDGGLFVPETFPAVDWRALIRLSPLEISQTLLSAFLPGCGDEPGLAEKAYMGKFSSPLLCPLAKVGNWWSLELYHGPTAAFKDVALSVLPRLISQARGSGSAETIHILTATSGDTGKAALEGFHDVPGTEITVFFPSEGVSAVQKAQMVTQEGGNVRVVAVRGNFDDCQRGVKAAFAEVNRALPEGVALSSANSINIGRLIPQLAYYFMAYGRLCRQGEIEPGECVDFSVPTGNFGDILAGYYARKLGLPIGRLICASNANNVLTDFLRTGIYDTHRPFRITTSPSMDILVSSNLERLLFDAMDGDRGRLCACMDALSREGRYQVDEATMERIRSCFVGYDCDDREGRAVIRTLWEREHYLCDPHTAVGFAAADKYRAEYGEKRPMVVLSTASPFKFPEAVLSALGAKADGDGFRQMEQLSDLTGRAIPEGLRGLAAKKVLHRTVIDADGVTEYVRELVQ